MSPILLDAVLLVAGLALLALSVVAALEGSAPGFIGAGGAALAILYLLASRAVSS
jgi:hypothetical protein